MTSEVRLSREACIVCVLDYVEAYSFPVQSRFETVVIGNDYLYTL